MINTRFELYKLKRELKRSGKYYKLLRMGKNKFGELNSEPTEIGMLKAIYHENNGYIALMTGETTQYRAKKTPMLLCIYEDAASLLLQVGDFFILNNKKYAVTGITDLQEWGLIADISLEVVDDGLCS